MYVLTSSHKIINIERCTQILVNENDWGYQIQASIEPGDERITLAEFSKTQKLVAVDVLDQLAYSISAAKSDHSIINLEMISKQAVYEFETGRVYKP